VATETDPEGRAMKKSRRLKVTSIRVDPEFWKLVRHLSIEEGLSIGKFLEKVVMDYVKRRGIELRFVKKREEIEGDQSE